MRRRGHPPAVRDKGESCLRRSCALGALFLLMLLFSSCADISSSWTNLRDLSPWAEAKPSSSPSAAQSSPSALPTVAPQASASPAPPPRRRAHAAAQSASAAQKPAPTDAAQGVPQLEEAESAGAGEPGAPPAEASAANAAQTITLGERPEPSPSPHAESKPVPTNASANPSSPAPTPTSSAARVNETIHAKAERRIRTVKATVKHIDQSSLSASEASRYSLATKLIGSAEKTMAEHDYAAAASLAKKASELLAPLPRRPESKLEHR